MMKQSIISVLLCSSLLVSGTILRPPAAEYSNDYVNSYDQSREGTNNRYRISSQKEDYDDYSVNTIPGVPGRDYPTFYMIPQTTFNCQGRLPGFYADEEAGCQVWHYCRSDGHVDSFLCPNGTVYNQQNRVCEWWFNVLCENVEAKFAVNEDLYIIPPPNKEYYNPEEQNQYNHINQHNF